MELFNKLHLLKNRSSARATNERKPSMQPPNQTQITESDEVAASYFSLYHSKQNIIKSIF